MTDAPAPPMPPAPPARPDRWDILRFVLFFILCLVLGILILAALAATMWGADFTQQLRDLGKSQSPRDIWLLMALQIVIYLCLMAAVWFAVLRRDRNPARVLAFNPVNWWMIPLGGLATIVLSMVVGFLLHSLTQDAQRQITEIIGKMAMTPALTIGTFLMGAVLAPLAEEMFFRGLLFGWLRAHWPFWLTALVTSALFGLSHGNLSYAVLTGILGLLLAYLRERTGSLWASIGAHALNNAFALGITILATQA